MRSELAGNIPHSEQDLKAVSEAPFQYAAVPAADAALVVVAAVAFVVAPRAVAWPAFA